MEKKEKRDTTKWLNATPFSPQTKNNYETFNANIKKESFNYGKVPFGSHSKQQFLYQTRVTHDLPSIGGPGPGSYGTALSPRDDAKVMGRRLSPGYSISKLGMDKNNSGTREILFHDKSTSGGSNFGISKTRKNSLRMGPLDPGSREVSLVSLKQK